MKNIPICSRLTAALLCAVLCLLSASCGTSPAESRDTPLSTGQSDISAPTESGRPTGPSVTSGRTTAGMDAPDTAPTTRAQNSDKTQAPTAGAEKLAVSMDFAAATKAQDLRLTANPSRGWRTHLVLNMDEALRAKDVTAYYRQQKDIYFNVAPDVVTTCYTYVYLTAYRGRDLPQTVLDALDKFFVFARSSGFTVLLTFAYCGDFTDLSTCADQATILRHIKQLAPLVKKNADAIHAIKQGFVGSFGEWADVYQKPAVNYATVTRAIVQELCVPAGLTFMHRMPEYKNTIAKTDPLYRLIGFGCDAMYGEQTRKGWESAGFQFGTPGWTQVCEEGAYTIQDGEMCTNQAMHGYYNAETGGTGIIPKGIEMIAQLGHHRYSTMSVWHGMYDDRGNDPIMDYWKRETVTPEMLDRIGVVYDPSWFTSATGGKTARNCYEFIRDHLGYRIGLQHLDFTGSGKAGSSATAKLTLKNFGFAAAHRMQSGFAVLDSNYDVVSAVPAGDPSSWHSHDPDHWKDTKIRTYTVSANIGLPDKPGKYYLAFYLKNGIDQFARTANLLDIAGGYNVMCAFTV